MSLIVRVITPDRIVWNGKAEELIIPTSTGQIGILKDHAPLLTTRDIEVIKIKSKTGWSSIALIGGFGEVEENNKVLVLCNTAKEGGSINAKAARDELEKITLLGDQATTLKEKLRATRELLKARARLQAAT